MFTGDTIVKIGLVACAISLVLQIIGFTCPGWVVLVIYLHVIGAILGTGLTGIGELTSTAAVWYGRVCIDGDFTGDPSCSTSSDHDSRYLGYKVTTALSALSDIDWVTVKVVLTLALCLCCIGIILAVLALCSSTVSPRILIILAAAVMLISGVLIIPAITEVAAGIFFAEKAVSEQEVSTGHTLVDMKPPWALVLSSIGLLFAVIASICFAVASYKLTEKGSMTITPVSTEIQFTLPADDIQEKTDRGENARATSNGYIPTAKTVNANDDGKPPRIGAPDKEAITFGNRPLRTEDSFIFPTDPNFYKTDTYDDTIVSQENNKESIGNQTDKTANKKQPYNKHIIDNAKEISVLYNFPETEDRRDSKPHSDRMAKESNRKGSEGSNVGKERNDTMTLQELDNDYNEGEEAVKAWEKNKEKCHGGLTEKGHEGNWQHDNADMSKGNSREKKKDISIEKTNKNSSQAESETILLVSPYGSPDHQIRQKQSHASKEEVKKKKYSKKEQKLHDMTEIYMQKLTYSVDRQRTAIGMSVAAGKTGHGDGTGKHGHVNTGNNGDVEQEKQRDERKHEYNPFEVV